ncbi:response regulator receiver protein [Winogradskyella aurantia]|uniref:Response regulator receiver protein n=2 Tax=Winogradskyella aurantia TaxID=1915063 RepID=A0A265UXW9_9FLAO|nr:response regulator receiver protein [Winogradskyella aurantia]
MNSRTLSIIVGTGYLIIFVAAIFANFFALESIIIDPIETVENNDIIVRLGIIAFLIIVVFDVVVAWALKELYRNHPLTVLSTYFRMMHAALMGVAIFALPLALKKTTTEDILLQVDTFNYIWLIGLFFFGIHILLLSKIAIVPRFIKVLLALAGVMYIVDTIAHFLLSNYSDFASIFLILVAIPSIFGEMSFALWLLIKGGKAEGK